MSRSSKNVMALDVGEKRIGVAQGDTVVKIAVPYTTLSVDGTEILEIAKIVESSDITTIVIGYPRNQLGEPTKQTAFVEDFSKKLDDFDVEIVFRDESLTSVLAQERLEKSDKPYEKADVDAMAACIILEQYLEEFA